MTAGHSDGKITFLIAVKLLLPNDFAALKIPTPTLDSCAFVNKKI